MKGTALFLLIFLMAGCATEKYHWGGYETALYQYYKEPADLDSFAEELSEVVEKGESRDTVPPGIYAEYGYLLFLQGRNDEAISCFQKEKNKWPESTRLMDIMIDTTRAARQKEAEAENGNMAGTQE